MTGSSESSCDVAEPVGPIPLGFDTLSTFHFLSALPSALLALYREEEKTC